MLTNRNSRTGCRTVLAIAGLLITPLASAQLYLVHDSSANSLYTIDVTTAAAALVGAGASGSTEGLALSGSGTLFYGVSNDSNLYSIARDGSGVTSQTGSNNADRGLAFNTATGILYGSDNTTFGSIDPTTNTLTALASPPAGDTEGLAADPANNVIFAVDSNEDLVAYDVATDTWSVRGATSVSSGNDIGVAYDPNSQTVYAVDSTGVLYSIDPSNGATTTIGNTGLGTGLDVGLTFVPTAAATYSISGNLAGLSGSATLQNNGTDDLAVSTDGVFTFATPLASGATYAVTVSSQPAGQTCSVTNGSGTVATANVTNVGITCADDSAPPPRPNATAVPTMGIWSLGMLTGLIGLLGMYYRRGS